jgi:hypothetical protein
MKTLIGYVLCLVLWLPAAHADSAPVGQRFKRVVQIVFENTSYSAALGQPNFAALVRQGALLTNLVAENHPSQGNYVAMIAGDTLGVKSDNNVDLDGLNIADLLEATKLRWKVYAEEFPGNCFTGLKSGNYVRKHNPFMSFVNVSRSLGRCDNIVEAAAFESDVAAKQLPEYSLYVPNLLNDGHNTGVDFAGKWMAGKFGPIMANADFMKDTLFIITFDESEGHGSNQVFTVLVGAGVKPGSAFGGALGHPGLLRMVEDEFRLGSLHRLDETSNLIEGIWK